MELELHRVDCLASHGMMTCYEFLRERLDRQPPESIELPEPLLNGEDLIAAGYRPGPEFREMLDRLMDAQLEGVLTDKAGALEYLRENFPPESAVEE